MDRREFLEQFLRLFALGLVPAGLLQACTRSSLSSAPAAKHGAVIAPSHCLAPDGKSTIFSFYDLDRDELRELAIPLELPHVSVIHPRQGNLVFVPESAGERACVIDVRTMKVVRELLASPGRLFGGHGDFTADGSLLYASEFEPPPSGKGFLTVLDGNEFSILRSHPTGGHYPHDVVVSADGKQLHIANLGVETGPEARASGTFVSCFSLPNEKLLERIELDDDPSVMNGNASISSGSRISRSDPVVNRDAHYFISYMKLAHPQNRIFFYPPSHQPIVDIWDIPDKRLLKEFVFDDQPVALTVLQKAQLLAVATASGRLVFIDLVKKEIDRSISLSRRIKVTTHINSWTAGSSAYS